MNSQVNFSDIFKSSFLEKTTSFSVTDTLIALGLALAIGLFIFLIYKKTFKGVMYSESFGISLIAMTLITTLIILAITSNVILSLGMVGALSIVRFRSAINEYTEAVSNLLNFGLDRSTSISAQLDGSQPSTSTGTIETTVNLTAMGQQGGGNNKGGMVGMNMAFNKDTAENSTNNTMTSPDNNIHENNNTSSIDKDLMMQAMQIIQTSEDGSITDSIKEQLLALGLNNDDITKLESIQTSMPGGNSNTNKEVINNNFAMVPGNSNSSNFSTLLLTGLSILLLIISFIFVKFSSKRKYTS